MLGTVGGIYSRFNPRICKRCDLVPPNSSIRNIPNERQRFNPRICKRCDTYI